MTVQRSVLAGTLANVVQVRTMWTCEVIPLGGDTYNILWGAYMSSLFDAMEPLTTTVLTWHEYQVEDYQAGHWVPNFKVAVNETGAANGEPLPYQNALVLLGKAAGLRKIGRKFIPGISEGYGTAGDIVGGMLTLASALLLAYIAPFTGLGGGTITPGVVDKTGTFRPFTSGLVSSLMGSMRRRKPGIGI